MNKLLISFVCVGLAFMLFMIGYRVGDARGYDEGYRVGYTYDCKEEIRLLHSQAESLGRSVEFTETQLRTLSRANDSLRRPAVYDTMHARFTRDSIKYHKNSKRLNDSLRKVTGSSIRNIVSPDGRVNYAACVLDSNLGKLPECNDGWRPSWRK